VLIAPQKKLPSDISLSGSQSWLWSAPNMPLAGGGNMEYTHDWSRDGKWLIGMTGGQVWKTPFPPSAHAETVAQRIFSNPDLELSLERCSSFP